MKTSDWDEAMDLWREDAARAARRLDADGLADRILSGAPSPALAWRRASWGYVAAAVALLALGLGGSLALGPHPARASMLERGGVLRRIEEQRLSHLGRVEWQLHPLHLGEKER